MPSLPPENRHEIDDLRRRVATLESQNKDLTDRNKYLMDRNCKLKLARLEEKTRTQNLGAVLANCVTGAIVLFFCVSMTLAQILSLRWSVPFV